MKVTGEPVQVGLEPAVTAIETEGAPAVLTDMVIELEATGAGVEHEASGVIEQVMTSLSASVVEV